MRKNIRILLMASILLHSGINLLAPIYAIFIKKIGGTLLDAGIAVGIYALLKGVLFFVFGKMEDRRGSKKYMIAGGYSLFCLSYILYIFVSSPYHVYGIQILLAVGETVVTPAWSAMIALSLEKGKERKIYSNFYGYRSLFEGAAAILGGFFAMEMGFYLVFIVMALFALAASGLSLFLVEEEK